MYVVAVSVIIVVVGYCFWQAYLLLVHPKVWVEWFLAKPWRSYGVAVSIVDEQKLRKWAHWFGVLMLVSGLVVATIALFGESFPRF